MNMDWRIDTSTGREILVFQNCSVIEDEQARYVLLLIQADRATKKCVACEGTTDQHIEPCGAGQWHDPA